MDIVVLALLIFAVLAMAHVPYHLRLQARESERQADVTITGQPGVVFRDCRFSNEAYFKLIERMEQQRLLEEQYL